MPSDDDFGLDDEIFLLATQAQVEVAPEKKRKKRPSDSKGGSGSAKRRKTEATDSESEEDDNPYPLEGKYKDAADRQMLSELSEMQREQVLAQRQEEMQRRKDKMNLDKLFASQNNNFDDSVSQAAKRKHTVRGSTKEKSHTLDQLRAKRKAKEERMAQYNAEKRDSPVKRAASASSDMDTSSDEDGQVSPPRDYSRKRRNRSESPTPAAKVEDRETTLQDLLLVQLTRSQLVKECFKPWFEDYVRNAWVRYLIGNHDNKPIYRACRIKDLGTALVAPYSVENEMLNQQLELVVGDKSKCWNLDKVSNSPITADEWRWIKNYMLERKVPIPTLGQLSKKREQIKDLENRRLTESDVSAMIKRRQSVLPKSISVQERLATKSRLIAEHKMAVGRQDWDEAKRLQEELNEWIAKWEPKDEPGSGADTPKNEPLDKLEKITMRNRQLNLENARRVEALEAEKRRRARIEAMRKLKEKEKAEKEGVSVVEEDELLKKNPELADKDIGTRMAHLVEINIDF